MSRVGRGGAIAVRTRDHVLTHAQLESDVLGLRSQIARGGRARLSTGDAAVVAAALTALDGWASEVSLVPPDVSVPADDGVVMLEPLGSDVSSPTVSAPVATSWVLYTSGTTGEPKAISHTRSSLTRTVAAGIGGSYVWGLLYDPNRMAGLQVLLQGLTSGATIVAPPLGEPLHARVGELVGAGVDAVSATPSLWRRMLQLPAARSWGLRQITLGGEIADQRVLDALASTYPDARIVHVFASTETGAAFSVKDGRAGFPSAYLTDPPRGIRLEIRDDVLHVHSPEASAAGDDGFASTGDIVEIVADRVLFRGRSSGVVNIGGSNVWPEVVETILREHPDVVEAVVAAKANSMTGNVLVARVELVPSADPEGAAKRLRSWVRDRAPRTHVPASVEVTDRLGVSAAGKVER